MTDFLDRWAQSDAANARLVAQETLILEATEALWRAIEQAGITKSELAERLGATKGHVSQVLGGSRNMTLRTFSDLCFALDARPQISVEVGSAPAGSDDGWESGDEQPITFARRSPLQLVVDDGERVDPDCFEVA